MSSFGSSPPFSLQILVDTKSTGKKELTVPKSEAFLIARFQAGDEAALKEIIETHKGSLHRFIYRQVMDFSEAEDILYHTFVKAWQSRQRYRAKARFQTWLYTIARNLCCDHARKRKRHPADFAAISGEFDEGLIGENAKELTPANPAENAVRNEDVSIVRNAIDELPPDLRSALILFSLEGHSQEEAALILGCSAKAVETRVYRAKKHLRKIVEPLRKE